MMKLLASNTTSVIKKKMEKLAKETEFSNALYAMVKIK
jgi:hypothetical protein